MREKSDLQEERIADFLWDAFGLQVAQLEFLPLGSDYSAAVYHVVARDSAVYFLKLRKGTIEEIAVLIPRLLYDRGIQEVIPPLKTRTGDLWASLDSYTCILYPFIEGRSGFETPLSDEQWVVFGSALKDIHTLDLPAEIKSRISSETYSSRWREMVQRFQTLAEQSAFSDPLATQMAAFMRLHRDEIRFMVDRAEQLGSVLKPQSREPVLCHSDIHAGNLLLAPDESLYIVDWDEPILAPKERDLMFIGAGVGGIWNSRREEELFYSGYGQVEIDRTALAYYRCERIVEDFAAYGEQILLSQEGGADREQGFKEFTSLFVPNGVIEIALWTDRKLGEGS